MRLTTTGKFWIGYAIIIAASAALAIYSCRADARERREAYDLSFRAVLCPPDWRATVSQRYDDRDRSSWIVKRTWITRCI